MKNFFVNRHWTSLMIAGAFVAGTFGFSAPAAAAAACSPTYIVRRGDSLATIARYCGVPLRRLELVNPQIRNKRVIYYGERIYIPGGGAIIPNTGRYVAPRYHRTRPYYRYQPMAPYSPPAYSTAPYYAVIPNTGRALQLSPSAGPAGSLLTVTGYGFPANEGVKVSLKPRNGQPISKITLAANASGQFTTQVTIPGSAAIGSQWMVIAKAQTAIGETAEAQFLVSSGAPYSAPAYPTSPSAPSSPRTPMNNY